MVFWSQSASYELIQENQTFGAWCPKAEGFHQARGSPRWELELGPVIMTPTGMDPLCLISEVLLGQLVSPLMSIWKQSCRQGKVWVSPPITHDSDQPSLIHKDDVGAQRRDTCWGYTEPLFSAPWRPFRSKSWIGGCVVQPHVFLSRRANDICLITRAFYRCSQINAIPTPCQPLKAYIGLDSCLVMCPFAHHSLAMLVSVPLSYLRS